MSDKWIPESWTFKDTAVAGEFEKHVREQLPWYDLATQAVALIGRHYIPQGGLVYDIGASTGNVGRCIEDPLRQRNARLVAIEESEEMAAKYKGPGELVVADALEYDFEMFDLAVCFLTLMFLPINRRRQWLNNLIQKTRPGGAVVIIDKIVTPNGYIGTVLRRLTMAWKAGTGTSAEDIMRKELSLSGYQRPMCPHLIGQRGEMFFRMGEFAGWVIERGE